MFGIILAETGTYPRSVTIDAMHAKRDLSMPPVHRRGTNILIVNEVIGLFELGCLFPYSLRIVIVD